LFLLHLQKFYQMSHQFRSKTRLAEFTSQFHQCFAGSIYKRRSPKCEKTLKCKQFFSLLGSARVESSWKTLVKLTPVSQSVSQWGQLHQISGAKRKCAGSECFAPMVLYFTPFSFTNKPCPTLPVNTTWNCAIRQ